MALDANVLIRDFWWKSAPAQELLNWFFLGHTLVIPEIIITEAANCLKNRAVDLLTKIQSNPSNRLVEQYRALFNKKTIDSETAEELSQRYKKFIYRIVRLNKGLIPATPEINLNEIIERSIQRKKPFNKGDKGFRDTLLWLNVIDIVKKYSRVSFVSQNTNDFGDENGRLHSELKAELSRHLPQDINFFYFKSLHDFSSFMDKEREVSTLFFERAMQANKMKRFDMHDWLFLNLVGCLDGQDFDDASWVGMPDSAEGPVLTEIEDVVSFKIHNANFTGRDIVEFYCDVAIVGYFDCIVYFDNPKYNFHPSQVLWNEKSKKLASFIQHVGIKSIATFMLHLTFNLDTQSILKSEGIAIDHQQDGAKEMFDEIRNNKLYS